MLWFQVRVLVGPPYAVNAAVHDKPAKGKLEFLSNSVFIPIFFVVTGFRSSPWFLSHDCRQLRSGVRCCSRASRREVDSGGNCRPHFSLQHIGASHSMVAHATAGGRDSGGCGS